jgi:hypothetical protein
MVRSLFWWRLRFFFCFHTDLFAFAGKNRVLTGEAGAIYAVAVALAHVGNAGVSEQACNICADAFVVFHFFHVRDLFVCVTISFVSKCIFLSSEMSQPELMVCKCLNVWLS